MTARGMFLAAPTLSGIEHVCANLRAWDRRELRVSLGHDDPGTVAAHVFRSWPRALVFHVIETAARTPCAVLWVLRQGACSAVAAMLTTDEFPLVALPLTRHLRRHTGPYLAEIGLTRLELRVHERHSEAIRWIRLCGAREEVRLRGFATDGADFIQMVWTITGSADDVFFRRT